jgi:hypothetical protein
MERINPSKYAKKENDADNFAKIYISQKRNKVSRSMNGIKNIFYYSYKTKHKSINQHIIKTEPNGKSGNINNYNINLLTKITNFKR